MKPYLLFPFGFKIIGVILLVPGIIFAYLYFSQNYELPPIKNNPIVGLYGPGSYSFIDELATTFITVGLLFIGFSQLRNERGSVHKLRLKALYWAVIINCLWIALFWMLVVLRNFMNIPLLWHLETSVTVIYNLFALLLLFIARFYYLLYKYGKSKRSPALRFLPYLPYNLIGKTGVAVFLLIAFAAAFIKIDDKYSLYLYLLPVFFLLWIASWSKRQSELGTIVRLKAMQIAVYINYALFIMATWVFYDINYLFALFFGLLSLQITFLITYYVMIYRASKVVALFNMG